MFIECVWLFLAVGSGTVRLNLCPVLRSCTFLCLYPCKLLMWQNVLRSTRARDSTDTLTSKTLA